MKRSSLAAIVIVLVLLVGAGLALNHKSNNNTTSNPNPTPPPTSQTSPPPSSSQNQTTANKVDIKNMIFTPAQVTVKKGETVTWTNNDSTAHTVTADKGTGPDSGTIQPGGTYSYTFNDAGSFQYHCVFHSSMHGTVVVQ
jgi:plastocyanin